MFVEERLVEKGLVLPEPLKVSNGVVLPFDFVRLRGHHAYVSGHIPLAQDGSVASPFGKLGAEITVDQGYETARLVALAMLGSLERVLGSLDRITAWSSVFGMVNQADGFSQQPDVINGFSELILDLFGEEKGVHARSAIGVAGLPFNVLVEIEAVVEVDV